MAVNFRTLVTCVTVDLMSFSILIGDCSADPGSKEQHPCQSRFHFSWIFEDPTYLYHGDAWND